MAVDRLILTDFRNHAAATLDAGPGLVVLTGENGAGKTNVLEALSLLAPGRGLRRVPLTEMARQGGSGGFGVAARLAAVELGTGVEPGAPERRIVRINGAPASANALAEWVTMLWLTPAMDRLFVEAPGERRRFLDRLALALAPQHGRHAQRYETAMRERNRLLAEEAAPDPAWLGALEARMAEHGAALHAARRETVAALSKRLADQPPGPFARASLSIEAWDGDADNLARALAEGRRRDAAAGRTLAGPHRADLSVLHLDKRQAAHLCSTGEQKALLLGIVLAHAELVADRIGRAPVLLLDEVAAHLDPLRRAALFERLTGRGQTWMTGTEPALFAEVPEPATRFRVDAEAIAPT
ncbi:MAG: DNA replication/repair protein RecF [Pseudomonadota bacterium]